MRVTIYSRFLSTVMLHTHTEACTTWWGSITFNIMLINMVMAQSTGANKDQVKRATQGDLRTKLIATTQDKYFCVCSLVRA